MAYYIDLFSPETYDAFSQSQRNISGFRMRHQKVAARIKPGDSVVCYMTEKKNLESRVRGVFNRMTY